MEDLECPICNYDFTENDEHVPRILPCYHTLCEACVKEILEDETTLVCPYCSEEHEANNGFLTFQQNKYILQQLCKKPTPEKTHFDKCGKHDGNSCDLFCVTCTTSICSKCLSRYHRKHDVMDLQDLKEEKCENLFANIQNVQEVLKTNKDKFLAKQRELTQNTESCAIDIGKQKEEFLKIFDKMIEKVTDHLLTTNSEIEDEISSIDDRIMYLRSIKNETSAEVSSYEEITNRTIRVHEMSMNLRDSLLETPFCTYFEYRWNRIAKEEAEKLNENLIVKETSVQLSSDKAMNLLKTETDSNQNPQSNLDNQERNCDHGSDSTGEDTTSEDRDSVLSFPDMSVGNERETPGGSPQQPDTLRSATPRLLSRRHRGRRYRYASASRVYEEVESLAIQDT